MLAGFGVGAAVAALPATAAITGAAAGWSPWDVGACALLALVAVFVVPPAPYLPALNSVPLIGSPRFRIELRLNGRRDMRIRIDDCGWRHLDVGTGPPIVMLHGEPAWSFIWRKVIPPLVDAGYPRGPRPVAGRANRRLAT
jgi:hypothetical protein